MSNTLVNKPTPFLINESKKPSKMHANAYKYIQSTDNDNIAQLANDLFIGIAALETIENCPSCKTELHKKVKSDCKSDSTTYQKNQNVREQPAL